MNPNSFPEIKKHVGGTAKYPAKLHVFEHDGSMWATTGYWVTPASRVAPLLEKYNLDPAVPGAYEVNGSVHRDDAASYVNAAGLAKNLDPALYTAPLVPVMVAGRQAYNRSDGGVYRAVYQTADGMFLALEADDLEWLSSVWNFESPEDCYYGPVRYLTTEPHEGKNRAVAVIADLVHRLTPVAYGTSPDGELTRTGGETENLGSRVLGIIASTRLDGK